MTASTNFVRGLRTFATDVGQGLFEITHNGFAMLGLAVMFVALTLTARSDLREIGEAQLGSWLQSRQISLLNAEAPATTAEETQIEAIDRATASIEALWAAPPSPPQLLHGDLTLNNVMVDGDRLIPIDFQDAVWGLDVQDLALSMVSLGRADSSDDLAAAFRSGYESVRPWPDLSPELLATLCAARRLHQLNLSLTLRKPGLDVFVARMENLIERWLRTPA